MEIGFKEPTEVQDKAIPIILQGKDIIVKSKTGTGKTGAFLIPIIQMLKASDPLSAMVIVPTRELAIQVHSVLKKLARGSGIRGVLVYGGASINVQIDRLREGVNIVIGTPGRTIDLMERGEIDVSKIKFLVLDEADMMLDLGFIDDIELIIKSMPREKQMMLFSATIPSKIYNLSQRYMKKAASLNISSDQELTVDTISHSYGISDRAHKIRTLVSYIEEYKPRKAIIFSDTKQNADYLHRVLSRLGYQAAVIHGDMRQAQRERSLMDFRQNLQFLVATNVASRGLDITGISHIINYDTPLDPFVYVHRVGRSARMGADGVAFSIVAPEEQYVIREIENSVSIRMKPVYLDESKFDDSVLGARGSDRLERSERRGPSGGGFRGYHSNGGRRPPSRSGGNYPQRRSRGRRDYHSQH
ncbi:DEAD/DEAH box helicase domain protein [mine drainage metagenome]|uniref:DEAD/DEAH box helicase domain protein n=2 Tax=mine drainage metagenome TaxID=410659 RepID=T1BEA2_9ZZZZ